MHYLETWKGSWGLGTSRKLVMASRVGGKIQNEPLFKSKSILGVRPSKEKKYIYIYNFGFKKTICEVFWEGHRNLKKYAS